MSFVEVASPRVKFKRVPVPARASQHSNPISLMKSGVKGHEDSSTRGLRSAKSSLKFTTLIRGSFAVLLFTVFFLPYFVSLLPSTMELGAVICRQPAGWVARQSGFLCTPEEDSGTSAVMVDALENVQQDFEELHEVAMDLSFLWSRFTHAQNQLEDAMFATRYSRYVGCQQTVNLIDGYRRDVSKVGRALRGFFNNVTHVAEILSINTYDTVERIEKNAKLKFLQHYWGTIISSCPHPMVQLGKTLRGNLDETSTLFLGGMGTLRDLDALNTQWEELRLCRDENIQLIQQDLASAERWIYFWKSPKRSYWYADRRKALKALGSFEGVCTEDARIAVQRLMDLAKDVSWVSLPHALYTLDQMHIYCTLKPRLRLGHGSYIIDRGPEY